MGRNKGGCQKFGVKDEKQVIEKIQTRSVDMQINSMKGF
jgi:hypothetical protein